VVRDGRTGCELAEILPRRTPFPNPDFRRELRSLSEHLDDEPRQVLIFKKSKDCEPYSLEGVRMLRLERRARLAKVLVLEGPAR
jgi:hypothetical protein